MASQWGTCSVSPRLSDADQSQPEFLMVKKNVTKNTSNQLSLRIHFMSLLRACTSLTTKCSTPSDERNNKKKKKTVNSIETDWVSGGGRDYVQRVSKFTWPLSVYAIDIVDTEPLWWNRAIRYSLSHFTPASHFGRIPKPLDGSRNLTFKPSRNENERKNGWAKWFVMHIEKRDVQLICINQ